jgi:hypothetical protein
LRVEEHGSFVFRIANLLTKKSSYKNAEVIAPFVLLGSDRFGFSATPPHSDRAIPGQPNRFHVGPFWVQNHVALVLCQIGCLALVRCRSPDTTHHTLGAIVWWFPSLGHP